MLTLRPLKPDDASLIIQMVKEFDAYFKPYGASPALFTTESYLRDGFGPHPAFYGFLVEVSGQPAGYTLYGIGYTVEKARRYIHIYDFFVRQSFRRQGVGRAMMHESQRLCYSLGGQQVSWRVWLKNKPAITAYQRLGATFLEDLTEEKTMAIESERK